MTNTTGKKSVIIPDIHGAYDILEKILAYYPDRHYIFLGDLIDRGPKSFEVVQKVRELVEAGKAELILGNHEEMAMYGLLYSYTDQYENWIMNGGSEVLLSYRRNTASASDAFVKLIDDMSWILHNAHDYIIEGNVLYSHAARPAFKPDSLEIQKGMSYVHVWNRPKSNPQYPCPEGVDFSVHGHTPHDFVMDNRKVETQKALYLDLGSYFSGEIAVWDSEYDEIHVFEDVRFTMINFGRSLIAHYNDKPVTEEDFDINGELIADDFKGV